MISKTYIYNYQTFRHHLDLGMFEENVSEREKCGKMGGKKKQKNK